MSGIPEIILEYVCWTLSILLSIRLFSNVGRQTAHFFGSTSMREVASKMACGTHNTKWFHGEKNTNQRRKTKPFLLPLHSPGLKNAIQSRVVASF